MRSNITEILHPKAQEMICGHGHEQKFKYPYSRDSKIIQMPYPRAKAIDQIAALCPASPRAGLTVIGALSFLDARERNLSKSRHRQAVCGETLSIVEVNSLPF